MNPYQLEVFTDTDIKYHLHNLGGGNEEGMAWIDVVGAT